MKKLSVLHINKFHYIVGGAEVIYFRTADILEKHGHSSVYFSIRHPNNLPCETEEFLPGCSAAASGKILTPCTQAVRLLSPAGTRDQGRQSRRPL